MFSYKDSEYTLDSAILLRDRKFIIDRAFLITSLRVYLYIIKIDNKYEKCLTGIIYLS